MHMVMMGMMTSLAVSGGALKDEHCAALMFTKLLVQEVAGTIGEYAKRQKVCTEDPRQDPR